MKTSDHTNEIAAALAKAQGQMEAAHKDRENPFFKSVYATLASVWQSCRKALADNGLSVVQSAENDGDAILVVTRLMHSSGQFFEGELRVKPVKLDPQGMGSALTYARRYAMMAMVGIAPADSDDDDGNAASRSQQQPQNTPRAQAATKQLGAAFAKGMNDAMEKAGLSREQLVAAIQKAGLGHLCSDADPAKWDASLANQIKGWVQKHQTKTPDQQPGE